MRPSVEDILEFKIQTNLFGAEQGRNSGATVDVITKSGTNSYHGSAFELVRNNDFDARNFFNAVGTLQPEYHQNQFGGSVGGPIIHNKVFFFGDYEGFRKLQGTTTDVNTVPTVGRTDRQLQRHPAGDLRSGHVWLRRQGPRAATRGSHFPGISFPPAASTPLTARVIQAYPLPSRWPH